MTLSTAYELPFEFLLSEEPLFGPDVTTHLRFVVNDELPMDEVRPLLHGKLMNFGVLGATGALGVLPASDFDPMTPLFKSVRVGKDDFAWKLKGWPAVDGAVSVLASQFMGSDVVTLLRRIEVSGDGRACRYRLAKETTLDHAYPATMPLPFEAEISHEGQDQFELDLTFDGIPPDDAKAGIDELLRFWAHAASSGAYGVAPVDPLKCGFQYDEEIDWLDNRLTWSLWRFRAHPDLLDGLLGLCGTFHAQLWPVLRSRID
ncbi:hypothetical protein PV762_27515 [Mitsuaria sp. CC2]|uniref:hypothetical protein n=1 Tax=Mitsuaria sp. CC2 TaxID=3029186 RepID=UPI003B8BDC4D